MKFLDGVKTGIGVTVGTFIGLYLTAFVVNVIGIEKPTSKKPEKSENTSETEEA